MSRRSDPDDGTALDGFLRLLLGEWADAIHTHGPHGEAWTLRDVTKRASEREDQFARVERCGLPSEHGEPWVISTVWVGWMNPSSADPDPATADHYETRLTYPDGRENIYAWVNRSEAEAGHIAVRELLVDTGDAPTLVDLDRLLRQRFPDRYPR